MNIKFYGFVCSVSGNYFNEGFEVEGRHYSTLQLAMQALKSKYGVLRADDVFDKKLPLRLNTQRPSLIRFAQVVDGKVFKINRDDPNVDHLFALLNSWVGIKPESLERPECPHCGGHDVLKSGWGEWDEQLGGYIFSERDLEDSDFCNSCNESITL